MEEGEFENISLLEIFMVLKIGIKGLEKELVIDFFVYFSYFYLSNSWFIRLNWPIQSNF